jgi:hypothetical protein
LAFAGFSDIAPDEYPKIVCLREEQLRAMARAMQNTAPTIENER